MPQGARQIDSLTILNDSVVNESMTQFSASQAAHAEAEPAPTALQEPQSGGRRGCYRQGAGQSPITWAFGAAGIRNSADHHRGRGGQQGRPEHPVNNRGEQNQPKLGGLRVDEAKAENGSAGSQQNRFLSHAVGQCAAQWSRKGRGIGDEPQEEASLRLALSQGQDAEGHRRKQKKSRDERGESKAAEQKKLRGKQRRVWRGRTRGCDKASPFEIPP